VTYTEVQKRILKIFLNILFRRP